MARTWPEDWACLQIEYAGLFAHWNGCSYIEDWADSKVRRRVEDRRGEVIQNRRNERPQAPRDKTGSS